MEYKKWLSYYMNKEEYDSIANEIENAELKTAGEIVTIVAKKSSTTGHVWYVIFTFLLIIGFVFHILRFDSESILDFNILIIDLVYISLAFFLAQFFQHSNFIMRILTPKADQMEQVQLKALASFYNSDIHKTKDSTGILIFISLMEHQVHVIADKAIADKHKQEEWDEVVQTIIIHIKNKQMAEGIKKAVRLCGTILQKDFPIKEGDKNELPDHLIVID